MDRSAVFVDAGYLFASGAKLVTGSLPPRSQLHLDHERVLELLVEKVREQSPLPLLRVYWYDGASHGPNPAHIALAFRESLKLRLGLVDEHGGQQGVDQLLAGDLVTLARNHAIADALLVSGDDDLRPAVEDAQALGVRVHLLGIAPIRENQAAALVQAADTSRELSAAEVGSFLSRRSK
ncbi:MAG TPA: NYN domain-containing protein [Polyangiaceae bacterium]|nr:NYN domain-containing protein [Polyangiaceae bacterium]